MLKKHIFSLHTWTVTESHILLQIIQESESQSMSQLSHTQY